MSKKRTVVLSLTLAAALLVLLSTPGTSSGADPYASPAVVGNRLVFPDMNSFGSFMEGVIHRNTSYLDELEDGLGFWSMRRESQKNVDLLGEAAYEESIVEDPFFATVLNLDGEIQIGDHVYKVTRNYVYRAHQGDASSLQGIDVRSQDLETTLEGVEVFDVVRADPDSVAEASLGAGSFGSCTDLHDSTHRVKGRSWNSSYFFYASAGAYTRNQKKKWYGWRNNRADYLWMHSTWDLRLGSARYSGNQVWTKLNAKEIRKVFIWAPGIGVLIRGSVFSEHFSEEDSGRTAECTTFEAGPAPF